jgi:formylmethanofuran dehydrogenase subunit B
MSAFRQASDLNQWIVVALSATAAIRGRSPTWKRADLVLIIGSNTAEAHPVVATWVKSAHKLDGQKLITSDLREHEMPRQADLFLHPKPTADLVWINAVFSPSSGQWPRTHEVPEPVGEWAGGIAKERGTFQFRSSSATVWYPLEDRENCGTRDR